MRKVPPGTSTMFFKSVPRERRRRLPGQVDERLAADVDHGLVDRAAGERPRRLAWIVVRDRSAALLPDVQALAGERELGRLGSDPPLTDGLVADVERQG